MISLFNEVFRWLPVACLVDGKVLVVHGGISPSTDTSQHHQTEQGMIVNGEHFVIQLRCFHFSIVLLCETLSDNFINCFIADLTTCFIPVQVTTTTTRR